MNRRILISIILLMACAYGSWRVLNNKVPSFDQDWLVFCLLWLSPWILFFGSIKAWHRCYTWRSMLGVRNIEPALSRGQHVSEKTKPRAHILEYFCCALFILSCAAILKQFGLSHIGWITGSVIFSIFILRVAIKKI